MNYCEKYKKIHAEYKDEPDLCINIERARLKKDSASINSITLIFAMFAILASVYFFIGEMYPEKKMFLVLFLLVGAAIETFVGIKSSKTFANNEFKLSVLDDILKERTESKEFRNNPGKECD
ncbi:hypothetical protein FRZ06_13230 [Anoxybacterium hadale]|uniref:Uncharacterized protein n=1 Tax=Anoxybacterium hadale TaxID=3408580 RepID=A0ACD1AD60_9FIRM|nr:hypothetical protein FRZ06_13230 [Clostridiales bacterium]